MGLKKRITEPDDSQPVTAITKEHQLQLRLFARIDTYKGTPPDRALFRELLITAGVTGTAHQVAWLIYGRTDSAGILEVGVKVLAADAGLHEQTVRRALPVLQKACVVRRSRAGKGKPYVYRINCGGMDWPMVRERAKRDRAELGMPETDPEQAGGGACTESAPGPETTVLGQSGCVLCARTSPCSVHAHRETVGPKSPTTSAREAGRVPDQPAADPGARPPGRSAPPSRFGRQGPASEGQRAYARKLGVTLPEDATNDSANEVIQSAKERKGKGFIATDSSTDQITQRRLRQAKGNDKRRTQGDLKSAAAIKFCGKPLVTMACTKCEDVVRCFPTPVDNSNGWFDEHWLCRKCANELPGKPTTRGDHD